MVVRPNIICRKDCCLSLVMSTLSVFLRDPTLMPSDVPRMGGHSTGVMKLLRTPASDGSRVKDETANMKNDSVNLDRVSSRLTSH